MAVFRFVFEDCVGFFAAAVCTFALTLFLSLTPHTHFDARKLTHLALLLVGFGCGRCFRFSHGDTHIDIRAREIARTGYRVDRSAGHCVRWSDVEVEAKTQKPPRTRTTQSREHALLTHTYTRGHVRKGRLRLRAEGK